MKTDISYSTNGLFVCYFANTAAGELAWSNLAKHSDGTGKFPIHMAASINEQLKSAGYTVRKAISTKTDDDALLTELGL